MLDGFIFGTMDFVCDVISGAGATKLWADICLNPQGGSTLYYAVIAAYLFIGLAVLGAIGNRLSPKSDTPGGEHQEPRS